MIKLEIPHQIMLIVNVESVFLGIMCVYSIIISSDSVQTRKINIDIIYLMDFPRFDEKISKTQR